jgi:hypothetical protein
MDIVLAIAKEINDKEKNTHKNTETQRKVEKIIGPKIEDSGYFDIENTKITLLMEEAQLVLGKELIPNKAITLPMKEDIGNFFADELIKNAKEIANVYESESELKRLIERIIKGSVINFYAPKNKFDSQNKNPELLEPSLPSQQIPRKELEPKELIRSFAGPDFGSGVEHIKKLIVDNEYTVDDVSKAVDHMRSQDGMKLFVGAICIRLGECYKKVAEETRGEEKVNNEAASTFFFEQPEAKGLKNTQAAAQVKQEVPESVKPLPTPTAGKSPGPKGPEI